MAARRRTARPRPGAAPATSEPTREAILDAALVLAGERGWGGIRLHDVAQRLGVSLAEIGRHYPDKDAVGNALFERATRAMLAPREERRLATLPEGERVVRALAAWFEAIDGHRAAARAIVAYKFAPAHVHLQAALVIALSRTVQWLREAARLTATGRGAAREEVRLTLVFAATFLYWLADRSPGLDRTLAFLRRRVEVAGRRLGWPR